jgi:AcrR family transcriptional regulator
MKSAPLVPPTRPYLQKARAVAAEATGQRIMDAFLKRLREQWFEDIILDDLARDSGVTVQTIMRRFGSKAGLLEAAGKHMDTTILMQRQVASGDVERAIGALTKEYEDVGLLILRLLAQEERHPVLKPVLDNGRRGHRQWLAAVFADELNKISPRKRTATLDMLVVSADVYVWKLVRLDMGRSAQEFKTIVRSMIRAVLHDAGSGA